MIRLAQLLLGQNSDCLVYFSVNYQPLRKFQSRVKDVKIYMIFFFFFFLIKEKNGLVRVVTNPIHLNLNLARCRVPSGRLGLSTSQYNFFSLKHVTRTSTSLKHHVPRLLPIRHGPDGELLFFNYKQEKVTI